MIAGVIVSPLTDPEGSFRWGEIAMMVRLSGPLFPRLTYEY